MDDGASPRPHLCACHRDPEIQQRRVCGAGRTLSARDLVWLDPCDQHRDEEIKQAAASVPNLNRP
ncbi:hypothetical protein CN173_24325 [Sinorhizobium meliloti]|nr:hypothetical protein CN173_24325 [Sinorhizobium meliloti]